MLTTASVHLNPENNNITVPEGKSWYVLDFRPEELAPLRVNGQLISTAPSLLNSGDILSGNNRRFSGGSFDIYLSIVEIDSVTAMVPTPPSRVVPESQYPSSVSSENPRLIDNEWRTYTGTITVPNGVSLSSIYGNNVMTRNLSTTSSIGSSSFTYSIEAKSSVLSFSSEQSLEIFIQDTAGNSFTSNSGSVGILIPELSLPFTLDDDSDFLYIVNNGNIRVPINGSNTIVNLEVMYKLRDGLSSFGVTDITGIGPIMVESNEILNSTSGTISVSLTDFTPPPSFVVGSTQETRIVISSLANTYNLRALFTLISN